MKAEFPGYYRPTESEFNALWESALIVPDTNVLFNLYRYSSAARAQWFELMKSFSDRLWIPFQVAHEFQIGRPGVIAGESRQFVSLEADLKLRGDELVKVLMSPRRFKSASTDRWVNEVRKSVEQALSLVQVERAEHPDLREHDLIREQLDLIVSGRVGPAYSAKEFEVILKEGEKRANAKIPPGFNDLKKGENKFGDFVLWRQLLDKAKQDKKDVLFVSEDLKNDWWEHRDGRTVGPLPALRQEFWEVTGRAVYLYSPDSFVEHAQSRGIIRDMAALVGEAKEVAAEIQEKERLRQIKIKVLEQMMEQAARENGEPTPMEKLKQSTSPFQIKIPSRMYRTSEIHFAEDRTDRDKAPSFVYETIPDSEDDLDAIERRLVKLKNEIEELDQLKKGLKKEK